MLLFWGGLLFLTQLLGPDLRSGLRLAMMRGLRWTFFSRFVGELLTSVHRLPHLKSKWPVSRVENNIFFTAVSDELECFSTGLMVDTEFLETVQVAHDVGYHSVHGKIWGVRMNALQDECDRNVRLRHDFNAGCVASANNCRYVGVLAT